jgi:hypothetical protein
MPIAQKYSRLSDGDSAWTYTPDLPLGAMFAIMPDLKMSSSDAIRTSILPPFWEAFDEAL